MKKILFPALLTTIALTMNMPTTLAKENQINIDPTKQITITINNDATEENLYISDLIKYTNTAITNELSRRIAIRPKVLSLQEYLKFINNAAKEMDQKNYKKAIYYYDKAAKVLPLFPFAYALRSYAYALSGDQENAIADAKKAITESRGTAFMYNSYGITQIILKNYPEAIEGFSKAVQTDDSYAPAYYNRSVIRNRIGIYDGALYDINKATNIIQGMSTIKKAALQSRYNKLKNKIMENIAK